MPRPKKTPIYVEGPQAFENFRNLAAKMIQPRRHMVEVTTEDTTEVTLETKSSERLQKTPGRSTRRK